MAQPASPEDQILKFLEQLYDQFGQDAVEGVRQKKPKRRGRVKSGRGAPTIDRELRDELVLALVEVVKLARGDDNTRWACNWLANTVTIRGSETRGGSPWERSWETSESLRRIYNKARKSWREDLVFRANLVFMYKMLIDWRCDGADLRWGFGLRGIPTHFDVLFSKRPTQLIDGIDKLQRLMEQDQSKK